MARFFLLFLETGNHISILNWLIAILSTFALTGHRPFF